MTFLSTLALGVALLVVAPYLAHRLRRRRAEERPFPPARLVAPAPPNARRRARLEDRALFGTRSLAVVALAILGATPFVRCSRLSLQRTGGASVAMAIVVDDSLSMRADAGGRTRFERARQGARELLTSAREGDAVAVVLGGDPARVALAATTDLAAARAVVDALTPTDRATDLEGAVAIAEGLLAGLPHVDRRVVVLSDRADGHEAGPPLGAGASVPVWIALPELGADAADCAVLRANQRGARVHVTIACGPQHSAAGRDVVVLDSHGKELGRAPAPVPSGASAEVTIALAAGDARPDQARFTGSDAIAADDAAPVVAEAGRNNLLVVVDPANEAVATGGAPIVEQALAALKLEVDVTPVPALPDRPEDLAGALGVLFDDPPGLTPEDRRSLGAFAERGGVVLLALGPHAAAAPLGANLEPILGGAVTWEPTSARGASQASAVGPFAESVASLDDLDTRRRAVLAPDDRRAFKPLVTWSDGATLVGRRALGRGEAWVVTLPFSIDESELPLRPAFLTLLDQWVRAARERAAPLRSEVGTTWRLSGARRVEVVGPAGKVSTSAADGEVRVSPELLGVYRLDVDGQTETRVAAPEARELDLRPRPFTASSSNGALGERQTAVDASGPVALVLLGLVALELALRVAARRGAARSLEPASGAHC
ncbi:MAG: VWA domain-containing protein [Polyangiaceae bacterium]|nr:VWA domain-containing protein [Polyangiaceae bacterium]